MMSKGNVGEGVWGLLWWLAIQQHRGARRFGLHRQGRKFGGGNRPQRHALLRVYALTDFQVLREWLVALQRGREPMPPKRDVSKGVGRGLRRLSVQENRGAGRFS